MGSSVRWPQVLEELTPKQRNYLKSIASGKAGTLSFAELGKLKSLDLIHHDGHSIALTSSGQVIVEFC